MSTPISYLVTVHNEGEQLRELFDVLGAYLREQDEIVVLDDFSDDPTTREILDSISSKNGFTVHQHALDNNYGEHKNWGSSKCKGNFIFQIDGDEVPPSSLLGDYLGEIIDANPLVELYYVPRINDFQGVTPLHAATWGWQLSQSTLTGRPRVNFPDYQGRIYKNVPGRIKWNRRLHEKIEGHVKYAFLPATEGFAFLHTKSIEKQVATNLRYNQAFTKEENQGHKIS